jgi:hypothetical protein
VAFAVAGEKQEMVADQETLALLKRFSRDPGVAKARRTIRCGGLFGCGQFVG